MIPECTAIALHADVTHNGLIHTSSFCDITRGSTQENCAMRNWDPVGGGDKGKLPWLFFPMGLSGFFMKDYGTSCDEGNSISSADFSEGFCKRREGRGERRNVCRSLWVQRKKQFFINQNKNQINLWGGDCTPFAVPGERCCAFQRRPIRACFFFFFFPSFHPFSTPLFAETSPALVWEEPSH